MAFPWFLGESMWEQAAVKGTDAPKEPWGISAIRMEQDVGTEGC